MNLDNPRIRVVPYNWHSQSALRLTRALSGLRIRSGGRSTFQPRINDLVINWGRSTLPPNVADFHRVLNRDVSVASNKLSYFQQWDREEDYKPIPNYWTNPDEIPNEAFPIVCRTVLNGHSGSGIVIAGNRGELVRAPLYVQYVNKQDEYRIHLGRGREPNGDTSIISVQRKARRNGFENPNWQVRNHQNGFVYVRNGVVPPDCVIDTAISAFNVTGLDFGACDVIYNQHYDRAYCLEINTAPGLQGQTVEDYANFFRSLV